MAGLKIVISLLAIGVFGAQGVVVERQTNTTGSSASGSSVSSASSVLSASSSAPGNSVSTGASSPSAAPTSATSSLSVSLAASTPPTGLFAPPAFTAAPFFPASLYSEYYSGYEATQTSFEPQPKVSDPVSGSVYPFNLTQPDPLPSTNLLDPVILPPSLINPNQTLESADPAANLSTPGSRALADRALEQINTIILSNATFNTSCQKCVAGLEIAKQVSLTAPQEVPYMMIQLCNTYKYSTTCEASYQKNSDGQIAPQVLANANVSGLDGQYICNRFIKSACPLPYTTPLNLTGYFAKPKPANATAPPPSGQRVKVAHLSDIHLDPRYDVGAESNCTSGLCCRPQAKNSASPNKTSVPAPRFGAYRCDSPYDLVGAALQAIPILTGTNGTDGGFNFTIYTGDLVSHDPDNQLSREYIEYTETAVYGLLKATFGNTPVYAALGNHDTWPTAMDAPHSLQPEYLANQYSWSYDLVSKLWETYGWINETVANVSASHYGAYSTVTPGGLRIITYNTDFWYNSNWYNYINMTNPDVSGALRFVADQLQEAEDAGQRAWVVGHVLPGWDGTNALTNPTDLFYQIVERYSPHVIAGVFMGHSHEDELSIFYANNATNISAQSAVAANWIGPSMTPLTNLNSAFRMYEVDAVTWDVMNAYTWYSDVNSFPSLDGQTEVGPTYHFEYSTRESYNHFNWSDSAPLNATFWHHVTEAMQSDPALVNRFNFYQGRQSARTSNCTSDACVTNKICYIRSGSTAIARQNCKSGFGSVQGG